MSTQGEDWRETKARADVVHPAIAAVLSQVFGVPAAEFEQATEHEDMCENTDIVHRKLGLAISCRVREWEATRWAIHTVPAWFGQCTIRSRRPVLDTELAKMRSGMGTHSIYAFANKDNCTLHTWVVLDLADVRRLWRQEWALETKCNPDGSSDFVVLELSRLPASCIVATSDNHPLRLALSA